MPSDLALPQAPFTGPAAANAAARQWCAEVNVVTHSEICAIPAERLDAERDLLIPLLPAIGRPGVTRKVDRLSFVRFGSARYSVPTRLIGRPVAVAGSGGRLLVTDPATGELLAEKALVAFGPVAEQFIAGSAASGNTRLASDLDELPRCAPPTGTRRSGRRWSGRWPSAAGGPGTSDPSSPPGPERRSPPGRGRPGHRPAQGPSPAGVGLQDRGAS